MRDSAESDYLYLFLNICEALLYQVNHTPNIPSYQYLSEFDKICECVLGLSFDLFCKYNSSISDWICIKGPVYIV